MKPEGHTETVTTERAAEAVQRLINSHFHNENRARCSIPANLDDDDLVASRYVKQSSQQIAALQQANERMRQALEEIVAAASGARQVACDDTEGMAWIDKAARAALAEAGGKIAND